MITQRGSHISLSDDLVCFGQWSFWQICNRSISSIWWCHPLLACRRTKHNTPSCAVACLFFLLSAAFLLLLFFFIFLRTQIYLGIGTKNKPSLQRSIKRWKIVNFLGQQRGHYLPTYDVSSPHTIIRTPWMISQSWRVVESIGNIISSRRSMLIDVFNLIWLTL